MLNPRRLNRPAIRASARLVLDQQRQDVLAAREPARRLEVLELDQVRRPGFHRPPPTRPCPARLRRRIIGKQFSSLVTWTSTSTGPSVSSAVCIASSISLVGAPHPGAPEGLGELHPVGAVAHLHGRVAPIPEQLLPLADHPEVAVVHQEHLDQDVRFAVASS